MFHSQNEKLQAAADRIELRELLHRYARAIDKPKTRKSISLQWVSTSRESPCCMAAKRS